MSQNNCTHHGSNPITLANERPQRPGAMALQPPDLLELIGLALLSMAVLSFEINLTRIFSVGQFYHFAFLIVSIALLGSGASGSFLAIFPQFGRINRQSTLALLSLTCGLSILLSYLLTNWVPFDSFRIAIDPDQLLVLGFHFIALSLPFFISGLATSMLLTHTPQAAGRTYSANLLGSALGCLIALIAPAYFSAEGVVVLSSGLAVIPAIYLAFLPSAKESMISQKATAAIAVIVLVFCLTHLTLRLVTGAGLPGLEIKVSPYKGLSYALQYPGAKTISTAWNSFSRVDLIQSPGIHSFPGLSFRYVEPPPRQNGILLDGDDLSPVVLPDEDWQFTNYLSTALPFLLKNQAKALILAPRGGLDLIVALEQGARKITAVEANPLIIQAASFVYQNPAIDLVIESDRSFLRQTGDHYDVIIRSLTSSYRPVRSGAYSLAEEYGYTLQAFEDALHKLSPDGIFFAQRWLQTPPCEEMRLFALAISALENLGKDPPQHIVALRSYNTAAVLVKISPFTPEEIAQIQTFSHKRAFDLIYAPGLQANQSNLFNILPEDVYYRDFQMLLDDKPREQFYARYPYQIQPPTDDQPFFGHFFKWSQTPQILGELGKTWQPFGGAGYYIVLLLLGLAILISLVMILAPIAINSFIARRHKGANSSNRKLSSSSGATRWFFYFAMLGFGFLLVEISLIQRFTLYLDQPAYAFSAVVFSLLLFSAAGSQMSPKISLRVSLFVLILLLACYAFTLPGVFKLTMGFPLPARLLATVLLLAPAGFLMGIPFPGAIRKIGLMVYGSAFVAWIWAINGTSSVVAAVLSALLALSFGYTAVLWIGAGCYLAAGITVLAQERFVSDAPVSPGR